MSTVSLERVPELPPNAPHSPTTSSRSRDLDVILARTNSLGLVALANQLLKTEDADSALASSNDLILVNTLGLDDEKVKRALERMREVSPQFDVMARELAA